MNVKKHFSSSEISLENSSLPGKSPNTFRGRREPKFLQCQLSLAKDADAMSTTTRQTILHTQSKRNRTKQIPNIDYSIHIANIRNTKQPSLSNGGKSITPTVVFCCDHHLTEIESYIDPHHIYLSPGSTNMTLYNLGYVFMYIYSSQSLYIQNNEIKQKMGCPLSQIKANNQI